LVLVAWVFFRSPTIQTSLDHLYYLALNLLVSPGAILLWLGHSVLRWIAFMLVLEWLARERQHALEKLPSNVWARWGIYLVLVIVIVLHLDLHTAHEFIYFQF